MIQIKNICKSYGDIQANSDVSLDIEDGKITGLIGPDGAGKSTLMRQLCALISPDSGHIQIDGLDTVKNQHQIRSMMGYMPQRFSLYPDLTVEQNILFFADLFNVPDHERKNRLEQLYQFSTLGPFKKRPAGKLSGGMKQKLALSCNLVHTPKYLILDEPTFGVDPVSRQEFWELIFQLKEDGVTVFVSTPYLDEAEMFDKVALMFRSRLIDYKVPEKIISDFPYEIYV
nr:ABC transporter ATP-binding protein [Candidatus Cloacimonadota bacterium]